MFNSVKGKTVIVTGGSKGIGKGIAKVFAQHGANVAIIGRTLSTAEECAAELNADGGVTYAISGDVTDKESMERAVNAVAEKFGGIDVLCANAGIFPQDEIEEISDEDWNYVMDTNVKGTHYSIQTCLPHLKKADYGRIILTSSITGPLTGYRGWTHYGASKAAQLGYMRSAALELSSHDITVNAVMPGNIRTEGLEDLGDEYLEVMTNAIPMGKLGEVEDIGYAAMFFASPHSSFITGQTIVVDGGQTVPEDLQAK
ncbi:3-oxoacyl-ACP reductase FabG [Pseudogracilibacillus auburnensis]|uniref:3-oxoacyl-ACP reductase FabG n=1 Tax=Pseudogracilibacillus auburnensis TaxID=1494959 RepID=UPI001A96E5B5|nr:3-oxoacyl-ACP reductase FabG [Pseudogracilibacillus auburnensis]MBO1001659.1 3-oxoacyl-ACP reductase FabG [Pseudogracilibacillus auburnensis]